ncbi:MAG: potassium-transporting ATPase subunit KdpB [Candidatus Altiarchaeota archaeon]|nr:potassium-transporting ATPase subunit KdpB [Candidatus Altiarchaeota archaeon]
MPGIFNPEILAAACKDAFKRLSPWRLWRNPVMFSVEIGSVITTLGLLDAMLSGRPARFILGITVWLWLTVLFSTFAESFAELRGKARTDELKKGREDVTAKRLDAPDFHAAYDIVSASDLKRGDIVLLAIGDIVPSDGEVLAGSVLMDESAVTGESAPVVRESGGERCGVVAGTKVIANTCMVKITVNSGETFVDRMVNMIDAAKRPKTPNEIALDTLLLWLTGIFLFVVANLWALSYYSANTIGRGSAVELAVLISLFVCLAPTTIAALLPAIGIAGMDRLFNKKVVVLSGKAVEAAGDVSTILLDKTGTITYGNRQAVDFIPFSGLTKKELALSSLITSVGDDTPEGKSILALARDKYGIQFNAYEQKMTVIPFTPHTRISGVDYDGRSYRKGAADSIIENAAKLGGMTPEGVNEEVDKIAESGGTPLLVQVDDKILGVIHLKDVLKPNIKERLAEVARMGIKIVIITGDNPLTAAHIAKEAGVEHYMAQAKPEDKLRIIRDEQKQGFMVAMTGDGTNDAPALAQADVAVAMSEGTQVAKEAANMIDLDNHPAKLIEIVKVGREILMTRGALTTFSIANDLAKYFAIVPAALYGIYPELEAFNILRLSTPESAILSAVIFNAIIIPLMIPLALKGVKYEPMSVEQIFRRNMLIYGLGGIIAPFAGIKIIDLIIGGLL